MFRIYVLTRLLVILLIFLSSFLGPVFAQNMSNTAIPPIIDVHVHVFGKPPLLPSVIEEAQTFLKKYGVSKALLSHPPSNNDEKVMFNFPALARLTQGQNFFGFLGGGGALNPMIHRHDANSDAHVDLMSEFEDRARKIIASGAYGFGEMGGLHISHSRGHAYTYQPVDHPMFLRLADISARSGLPLELHMDGVIGSMTTPPEYSKADNPYSFPDTISGLNKLLAYNRDAKISWAHGGADPLGEMTPDLIMEMMDKHSNLYMSLRIAKSSRRIKNVVWDGDNIDEKWLTLLNRHPDRFFIGSDAMFIPKMLLKQKPHLKNFASNEKHYELTRKFLSLLPKDLAAKIANENAERVFRPNNGGGQTSSGPMPGSRSGAKNTDAAMAAMDLDGDGRISKAEFKGSPKRWDHLDENTDGHIDREEMNAGFARLSRQNRSGGSRGGNGGTQHLAKTDQDPSVREKRKGGGEKLTADEIKAMVTGMTLSFIAPSNGQLLKVFFAPGGIVEMVGENNPSRIIRKKWSISQKGLLCRTVGKNDYNHCTIVKNLSDGKLQLSNPTKGFSYEATVTQGRALGS